MGRETFWPGSSWPAFPPPLGEQVLVDNRPSGIMSGELVARASPDGYTLRVTGNSPWIGPLLQDTPCDPVKDCLPITAAVTSPNVLIVHPSLSVRSVKELLALARARPGELNYGSSGTGSTNHLAAEMFKAMARVKIERVNYKGSGFALTALLAGEIQIILRAIGFSWYSIACTSFHDAHDKFLLRLCL